MWCFPNVILQQMAARTDVDAQGDCEKEYERDYSWLHCRNGTALREVARTLKRALGNTLDPLYGAYRTEDGPEGRQKS